MSTVLEEVRKYFDVLSAGYEDRSLSRQDFERHLRTSNLNPEELRKLFDTLDLSKDGLA